MVGIILAGGLGTRLGPITSVMSKQLHAIYDKPMIYYPLSLMMASGITEIIVITTPKDAKSFQQLLSDGRQWGISITFVTQENPNGLPEAFLLCRNQIQNHKVTLMLGDNILYGSQIGKKLGENAQQSGASIYGYLVQDVSSFGALHIDSAGKILKIIEKPKEAGRGLAIPGIYHFDETVFSRTALLKKSSRGELEIVDLLNSYLEDNQLSYSILDRGTAWLDTGTIDDLFLASELVRVVQSRQGMLIGSPEEVAFRMNYIDSSQLEKLARPLAGSRYGKLIAEILTD